MKAVVLLSGGLDSVLAAKLVQKEGIDLLGVTFVSYFFDNCTMAQKQADVLNIPLKVVDISQKQWQIVKNPRHGYGSGMNPCRDCHALMLREAKRIMKAGGGKFLVTGEVIGQRPLSQSRSALNLVEEEAGVPGLVLRPLSAGKLSDSVAEENSWVKKDNMLNISGRQRKKQLSLANQWGIDEFDTPAGGCLLTDPAFTNRLQNLLNHISHPSANLLQLLKLGRHFWQDDILIIVGRDEEENEKIIKLAESGNTLVELAKIPGPTTLIYPQADKKSLIKAKKLTKRYANKTKGKKVEYNTRIVAD